MLCFVCSAIDFGGTASSNTLRVSQSAYYNLPYPSEGATISLTVTSGSIACYGSVTTRNPSGSDYTWMIHSSGNDDLYLDPELLAGITRPRAFIGIHGTGSTNTFSFTTFRGFPTSGKFVLDYTCIKALTEILTLPI